MTTELEEKLTKRVFELEAELEAIRQMLTICGFCHNIRDPEGNWQKIANYLRDCFGMDFTHGICPECMKKNYPKYCKD